MRGNLCDTVTDTGRQTVDADPARRTVPVVCPDSPPVFWNRYARADDMVYIHTSQKVSQGRQSMILRTVLQRPVMILLRHLLFENLADRVELSLSS